MPGTCKGSSPGSTPVTRTTSNSRSLAACMVMIATFWDRGPWASSSPTARQGMALRQGLESILALGLGTAQHRHVPEIDVRQLGLVAPPRVDGEVAGSADDPLGEDTVFFTSCSFRLGHTATTGSFQNPLSLPLGAQRNSIDATGLAMTAIPASPPLHHRFCSVEWTNHPAY